MFMYEACFFTKDFIAGSLQIYKLLSSLPKRFHGPLTVGMHSNWPTDYATDCSLFG